MKNLLESFWYFDFQISDCGYVSLLQRREQKNRLLSYYAHKRACWWKSQFSTGLNNRKTIETLSQVLWFLYKKMKIWWIAGTTLYLSQIQVDLSSSLKIKTTINLKPSGILLQHNIPIEKDQLLPELQKHKILNKHKTLFYTLFSSVPK